MDAFFADNLSYIVLGLAVITIPMALVTVAYFWYKLRRDESLINLKRELAARGMGAEEIRTVIEARPPGTTSTAEDFAAANGTTAELAGR